MKSGLSMGLEASGGRRVFEQGISHAHTDTNTSTDAVAQDLSRIEDGHRAIFILDNRHINTAPHHLNDSGIDGVLLTVPNTFKTAAEAKAKKVTATQRNAQQRISSYCSKTIIKTIIAAIQSTAIRRSLDTNFRPNRDKLTRSFENHQPSEFPDAASITDRSQSNALSRVAAECLEARHG
jgi:hypothetical protein